MRAEFCKTMYQVLARDPRALLISGDLGFNAFEKIAAAYGRRFLNAGVAEQNMMGVAAGMAFTGLHPWAYSIIPFVTLRCLEQIRNDVCFHNLPVRIVGNGGGFTYGVLGSTHHALEDLGVLKTLPHITLFFPGVPDQVATAMDQMDRSASPTYLRLAVSAYATTRKPMEENSQTLTRHYQQGSAVTILGVGHAVQTVLTALEKGSLRDGSADVFGIAKFPLDLVCDQAVTDSVRKTRRVVVIEEHCQAGGIGESLKAALPPADSFVIMAAAYSQEPLYGSSRFHLKQCNLTPEHLCRRVTDLLMV
jgi:transketolase